MKVITRTNITCCSTQQPSKAEKKINMIHKTSKTRTTFLTLTKTACKFSRVCIYIYKKENLSAEE